MQGRIQIIKTFIISQFLYTSSSIHVPNKYIKAINKLIFNFLWKNKKEKIKRSTLHKDKDHGGLNVPDFSLMINASRLGWLKKYVAGTDHFWKELFEEFLERSGFNPHILLFANYNINWLTAKNILPSFYIEALSEWLKIGNTSPVPKESFIWYNKNILIENRPIFYQDFYENGICHFGDLYNNNREIIPFEIWQGKGITQLHFLKWAGIVTAISKNLQASTCATSETALDLQIMDIYIN